MYEQTRKGDYRVLMRLMEDELPTLLIRLRTSKKRLAEQAKAAFAAQAPGIIAYGYSLAMQPGEGTESEGVERLSATEYRVTAEMNCETALLQLQLTLPNEAAAQTLATVCRRQGEQIGQTVLEMLSR